MIQVKGKVVEINKTKTGKYLLLILTSSGVVRVLTTSEFKLLQDVDLICRAKILYHNS